MFLIFIPEKKIFFSSTQIKGNIKLEKTSIKEKFNGANKYFRKVRYACKMLYIIHRVLYTLFKVDTHTIVIL